MDREFATVSRDPALAGLVDEIDQLKDLSGKILAARGDRPKRQAEWKSFCSTREGLCIDLGVAIESVARLHVEQRKRVETLSGKYLVLEAKRNELPTRISGLESGLGDAKLALADVPPASDTANLAERLAQVRTKKQLEAELKRLRLEKISSPSALSAILAPYRFGAVLRSSWKPCAYRSPFRSVSLPSAL